MHKRKSIFIVSTTMIAVALAALSWWLPDDGSQRPSPIQSAEQQAGLSVVSDESLTLHEDCREMDSCVRYYLEYIRNAEAWAKPISEQQLEAALDSISGENRSVFEGATTAEEIRSGLVEAMNIGHLLDGLDPRELKMRVISEEPLGEIQQYELLFEDPFVGLFRALLLMPPGRGPFPGIVAHPGHSERASDHRDLRHGKDLAERGFAVLLIDPRANDGAQHETRVARAALLQGHSMIGLRVYEILLAQKYMRWDERVIPGRLGLQGHSGGSVAGNLAVRIDDGFAAYVSDLFSTYGIVLEREAGFLGDETSPAIYYWHASIEDLTTSRMPMIQEPYGYEDGPKRMFRFFEKHLN